MSTKVATISCEYDKNNWVKLHPYVGDDGIYVPCQEYAPKGYGFHSLLMSKETFIEAYNKWIKNDLAPVVHANWQEGNGYIDCVNGDPDESCYVPSYICSNCKCEEEVESDYCPNCGAKMDLEE